MRIATYNVEWFNDLFDNNDRLFLDDKWSARYNVTTRQQSDALGAVFRAMDADAVLVVEAPDHSKHRSTVKALEHFADHYGLRTSKACIGFPNDTRQEIALLYDPRKISVRHAPMASETAPQFDQDIMIEFEGGEGEERFTFSKPPLELVVSPVTGTPFRLIGTHMKSKAPHGASDISEEVRIALQNRRKQIAQAIWLRRRADQVLAGGEDLIILGDVNDGPGQYVYEAFVGQSSVDILMGPVGSDARLFDPSIAKSKTKFISTARFFKREKNQYLDALLDYILVSPAMLERNPKWTILHPDAMSQDIDIPDLSENLRLASDHFPVLLQLGETPL